MIESPMDQLRHLNPQTYEALHKAQNMGQDRLRASLQELMNAAANRSDWPGREAETAEEELRLLKLIEEQN